MSTTISKSIFDPNFPLPLRLLGLRPSVQNYHWGKIGEQSLAARLIGKFDPTLPYAELWYGSHPKAPSQITQTVHRQTPKTLAQSPDSEATASLNDILKSHSMQILGEKSESFFGPTLPFLAKILSIEKALSLQAHPSLENAKLLHTKDPLNYPDTNHKPEIAIALTKVELLHGWISENEVVALLLDFPELERLLIKQGIKFYQWNSDYRKSLVLTLFNLTPAEIAGINNLIIKSLVDINTPSCKQKLFLSLAKQVELADVGLLFALFLRHLTLSPGQSIYTPAGEIHAYLSGDLFECMANSDNVIRAGLTPKFQDVSALLEYANFEEGNCKSDLPSESQESSGFMNYDSGASEFSVSSNIKTSGSLLYKKSSEGPELIIQIAGTTKMSVENQELSLSPGEAVLIPAKIKTVSFELENASLFRIHVPFLNSLHA